MCVCVRYVCACMRMCVCMCVCACVCVCVSKMSHGSMLLYERNWYKESEDGKEEATAK